MSNQELQTVNSQLAEGTAENEALKQFRIAAQKFVSALNSAPKQESIGATADGRASTVNISHIEMTLDEYYFGLWSTENFKWSVIGNEVVGSIDLIVTHPVTGKDLRRTGAGSIVIMVDKVPDSLKDNQQAAETRFTFTIHSKPQKTIR